MLKKDKIIEDLETFISKRNNQVENLETEINKLRAEVGYKIIENIGLLNQIELQNNQIELLNALITKQ